MRKRTILSFYEYCPAHQHIIDMEVELAEIPNKGDLFDGSYFLPENMKDMEGKLNKNYFVVDRLHKFNQRKEQLIIVYIGMVERWMESVYKPPHAEKQDQ